MFLLTDPFDWTRLDGSVVRDRIYLNQTTSQLASHAFSFPYGSRHGLHTSKYVNVSIHQVVCQASHGRRCRTKNRRLFLFTVYKPEYEHTSYDLIMDRLIQMGYPAEIRSVPYVSLSYCHMSQFESVISPISLPKINRIRLLLSADSS